MENRLVLLLCFFTFQLSAQNMTRSQYIDKYKDEAVYQMRKYKIPASITLAQGILESGNGNSELANKSNNHFGIKCHKEWKGKSITHDDDEKDECFRSYKNPLRSYRDHSLFLVDRDRYSSLFTLNRKDYKGWPFCRPMESINAIPDLKGG